MSTTFLFESKIWNTTPASTFPSSSFLTILIFPFESLFSTVTVTTCAFAVTSNLLTSVFFTT